MLIAPEVLMSQTTRSARSVFARSLMAVAISCGLSMASLSAHAARAADEVAQLIDQGKMEQAAKQADAFLKQSPNDAEMRFLRGVIATEQKQSAQAIKIFTALTRDFPSLPEPYNNLAVLYAADGQERKAAEALEQAIRTNPSYTTAHENLGDLYARMASEAYSKALELDSSRQAIKPKLALITQLATSTTLPKPTKDAPGKTVVAQAPVAAPAPAPVVAPVAPAAPVAAPTPPVKPAAVASQPKPEPAKPEPKPEPVKPEPAKPVAAPASAAPQVAGNVGAAASSSAPASAAKLTTPPVAAPAPAPAPRPAATKPAPSAAAVAEVESAVNAWAAAWAKKDLKGYFDAYSDKFAPAGGASQANWREARRVRIVGKDAITVKLQNLSVKVDGDQATAQFRQHYVAGGLNSLARKTLNLRHENGQWKIVRESTGG